MLDFHEKRRLRTALYSKYVLGAIAIILLFSIYSVWGVYEKERETRNKRDQRAAVLTELEQREFVLREEVDRLSTDRGVEEEIRGSFKVVKEGEEVIVIVDAPKEEEVAPVPVEPTFWERVIGVFQ